MMLRVCRVTLLSVEVPCRYKLYCFPWSARSSSAAVPTHSYIITCSDDRPNSAGCSSDSANVVVVHSAQEFCNAVSTLFSFDDLHVSRQLFDKISMNSVFKHHLILDTHRKLRPELHWIHEWLWNIVVNKADPFPISIPQYRNPFLARLLESTLFETREFLMLKISNNLINQLTVTKTQRKLISLSAIAANSTIPDIARELCNILPSYHIEELIQLLEALNKSKSASERVPSSELVLRLKNILSHHFDALVAVLAAIEQLPTRYSESYRQKRLQEQTKNQTRLMQSMEAAFARVKEGPRPGEHLGESSLKRQKTIELEDELMAIFSNRLQRPIAQVVPVSNLIDAVTSSIGKINGQDFSIIQSVTPPSIMIPENIQNEDLKQESISMRKLPQSIVRGWVPNLMDKTYRAFETPLLVILTCEGSPSTVDIRATHFAEEQAQTQIPAQFKQDMNKIVPSDDGYMSPYEPSEVSQILGAELDEESVYDRATLDEDRLYGRYKLMIVQLPWEVNESVIREALSRIGGIQRVVVIPSQKVYAGKDSMSDFEIEKSSKNKVSNSRGNGNNGIKKKMTQGGVIDAIASLKSGSELDNTAGITDYTIVDSCNASSSELSTIGKDEFTESDVGTKYEAADNVRNKKDAVKSRRPKLNKQRKVAKHNLCDGHAFVWLDETSYHKACRDDTRIFGINIMGKNCPIMAAANLRTLYLEIRQSGWPLIRAQYYLQLLLGCSINVSECQTGTTESSCRPAYLQLRCENHTAAWTVFTLLRSTQFARRNFRVTWIKPTQYRVLGVRMKDVKYAHLARSIRSAIRKSQAGASSAHGLAHQVANTPANGGECEDQL